MFGNCVALAIMPIDKIDEVFEDLIIVASRPLLLKYSSFSDFLIDTWIGDDDVKAIFDRKLWNHWDHLDTRTNNNNESYNLRLQKKLGTSNPNVWVCIEAFQKEEVYTSVNYVQVDAGNKKSRGRAKKEIEKDLQIANAKINYCITKDLVHLLESKHFYFLLLIGG